MVSGALNVVERGRGPAMVFLHGFPFDHEIWRVQFEELEDCVHLIAPDLPGFGKSPAMPGTATMESYADVVAGWLKAAGHSQFTLVGHSMGGYIAFAFAHKYPELLSGLVLVCTRPGADSEAGKEGRFRLIKEVQGRGPRTVVESMLPRLLSAETQLGEPDLVDRLERIMLRQSTAGIITALHAMAARPDATGWLKDIRVPALLVAGDSDPIIPPGDVAHMSEIISDVRYTELAGCAHMPMMENPDEFSIALRDFMGCEA